jgi:hypothetical protein
MNILKTKIFAALIPNNLILIDNNGIKYVFHKNKLSNNNIEHDYEFHLKKNEKIAFYLSINNKTLTVQNAQLGDLKGIGLGTQMISKFGNYAKKYKLSYSITNIINPNFLYIAQKLFPNAQVAYMNNGKISKSTIQDFIVKNNYAKYDYPKIQLLHKGLRKF